MRRILTILLGAISMLPAASQPIPERNAGYRPDGRAFLCVNGDNRFTRALYGSPAEYRIETSDRPIFALYRKRDNLNIRLRAGSGGHLVRLDSAEYCESRYEAGRRDYLLRDSRWGGGEMRISALACHDSEGAVWKVSVSGFQKPVDVEVLVCETSAERFSRAGDIGKMEKPGGFEAPADPKKLQVAGGKAAEGRDLYVRLDGGSISAGDSQEFRTVFERAESDRERLASSVVFDTPDPYINTLGGTLVAAADGAWDGRTWQHGAVGWRMPLPGWRGAYMGDFLGMPERQRSHFDAYALSQVDSVPVTQPHLMDSVHNLSRGAYRWGTPMYSNGYICRNPGRNDQFHHYDMNLVFVDELLWHLSFDADSEYMRRMWPLLKSHLEWEKRTWDPDGDGLYDAYCCIWASDALQYSSGAVTHSSAYNYRGNLLAARIAETIGEDPAPYRNEAERISRAMAEQLWLPGSGHWAEYRDFLGKRRTHDSAALWSVYTPVDCGPCSPEQAYSATRYVDARIPRIPFRHDGEDYFTISTTDWAPYEWSINNVAMAEVMHTALAYYKAGRPNAAFRLLKGTVLDFMYLGSSPGNFGQLSALDCSTGEAYRDFADVTGISSRALIEGLYGITPDALNGRCVIRPGFPDSWDSASVRTPYLEYSFRRENGKEIYDVKQNFRRPLQIVIRRNTGDGGYEDTPIGDGLSLRAELAPTGYVEPPMSAPAPRDAARGTALADVDGSRCRTVDISVAFNSNVADIFNNRYLSPRSPYTTLCLPAQGIGDWCSTKRTANIDDSGLRASAENGVFMAAGIPFLTPASGRNIIYTSLWDNYPDSVTVPLRGRGRKAYLMLAGSTNPMQSRFDNGEVRIEYTDGSFETLALRNPDNWCPIEQDYHDAPAFALPGPRPVRVGLMSGRVSRTLADDMAAGKAASASGSGSPFIIDGGAAQLLEMPLDPGKALRSLTLSTTAIDVVTGLMAVTIQE